MDIDVDDKVVSMSFEKNYLRNLLCKNIIKTLRNRSDAIFTGFQNVVIHIIILINTLFSFMNLNFNPIKTKNY